MSNYIGLDLCSLPYIVLDLIQSVSPSIDNTQKKTQQHTLRTQNGKTLHHMTQSSRSPIGVNLFWETWIAAFKMAVIAQHNLEVDKLLRLKPAGTELFYPTMPTLEEEFENEENDEARHREPQTASRETKLTRSLKV